MIFGRIQLMFFAALAGIAGVIGLYAYGRRAGAKAVQLREQQHTLKVVKEAQRVEVAISNTSDGDITQRLHDSWSRD